MKIQTVAAVFAKIPHSKLEDIATILVDSNESFDHLEDEARQEEINIVMDILIQLAEL